VPLSDRHDTPLHDEVGQHAEEVILIVEVHLHQLIKAIRADGSPIAMDKNYEIAFRRRELRPELFGRRPNSLGLMAAGKK
jgi:hypothetical protein